MDFVDEEKRPLPDLASRARRVEHLLEVADAGADRRDLLEMEVGRSRQQPRYRGLAGTGRSPKDERAQRSRIEQARERAVGTEQMVLADDFAEPRRPQLVGERPRRVALEPGGREQARAGALGARRHPRSSTDSCWPPRTMVMLQRRRQVGHPGALKRRWRGDDQLV